ncbi:2-hydroxychromene-2-carboxylate isomerase [Fodinicurvata sp. EGI_FJ10296]|uniref:2-hydroxychromene-2-carboxylate isomerase n=1 Tax=Fodinicurvata sp. EGI_FJ10296 TaxID=3231908 RepID=UPI0034564DAF
MTGQNDDSDKAAITFYFDFSSPYAYLAVDSVLTLAARHGRAVDWRPILLGVVFRATGAQPLADLPLKGDYLRHDCPRFARMLGLPFVLPEPFPFATVAAARAVYWAESTAPGAEKAVVRGLLHEIFGRGQALIDKEAVAKAVAALEVPGLPDGSDEILDGMESRPIKDRLKTETDSAIAVGVFGSPFIVADGEAFWGADRLDHVDWWLSGGEPGEALQGRVR